MDKSYIGQNSTRGGKDQRSRERAEDLKPTFRFFRLRTAITAVRAAASGLGDRCRTFFAFGECHNGSAIAYRMPGNGIFVIRYRPEHYSLNALNCSRCEFGRPLFSGSDDSRFRDFRLKPEIGETWMVVGAATERPEIFTIFLANWQIVNTRDAAGH